MGGLSAWHYLVVAIVAAFLFFGWKQLPDMARSFGRSLRVFKTEIKGMTGDDAARDAERDGESAEAAGPKQLTPKPTPVAQASVAQASVAQASAAQAPASGASGSGASAARETPRAEVVRNAPAAAPAASSRPRPTPNRPAR